MSINTTYEKDVYCVRAKYVKFSSDKLLAFSGRNLKSPSGKFDMAVGLLVQSKPELAPGKLTLVIPGVIGTGEYWVIGVSDIDTNTGKYTWSGIKWRKKI